MIDPSLENVFWKEAFVAVLSAGKDVEMAAKRADEALDVWEARLQKQLELPTDSDGH